MTHSIFTGGTSHLHISTSGVTFDPRHIHLTTATRKLHSEHVPQVCMITSPPHSCPCAPSFKSFANPLAICAYVQRTRIPQTSNKDSKKFSSLVGLTESRFGNLSFGGAWRLFGLGWICFWRVCRPFGMVVRLGVAGGFVVWVICLWGRFVRWGGCALGGAFQLWWLCGLVCFLLVGADGPPLNYG